MCIRDRDTTGDQFAASVCDEGIVFNPDAKVVKCRRDAIGWTHIKARLNGQDHTGPKDAAGAVLYDFVAQGVAPLGAIAQLTRFIVAAAVVHVHAQPVAGAVHVESLSLIHI